jgi:hypothetical protein
MMSQRFNDSPAIDTARDCAFSTSPRGRSRRHSYHRTLRSTMAADGADNTSRGPCDAHGCPEIHYCLIPLICLTRRGKPFGQSPDLALWSRITCRLHRPEDPGKKASHVYINDRCVFPECRRKNRVRGVFSNPWKIDEVVEASGYSPAVSMCHRVRETMQPRRAIVVPHSPPRDDNIPLPGRRESSYRGELPQEPRVLFKDATYIRLLEHDLRHEDAVRVGDIAPGERTSVT